MYVPLTLTDWAATRKWRSPSVLRRLRARLGAVASPTIAGRPAVGEAGGPGALVATPRRTQEPWSMWATPSPHLLSPRDLFTTFPFQK